MIIINTSKMCTLVEKYIDNNSESAVKQFYF